MVTDNSKRKLLKKSLLSGKSWCLIFAEGGDDEYWIGWSLLEKSKVNLNSILQRLTSLQSNFLKIIISMELPSKLVFYFIVLFVCLWGVVEFGVVIQCKINHSIAYYMHKSYPPPDTHVHMQKDINNI